MIGEARPLGSVRLDARSSDTEPAQFTEPASVRDPRRTERCISSIVQTMPFSRPPMPALLKTLTWVIENDYPARGEVDPGAL